MLAVLPIYQAEDCRYSGDTIADDPVVDIETSKLFSVESEEED